MTLGARDDLGDARFVGCERVADARASARASVRAATRGGFDFASIPIAARDEFATLDDECASETYPRTPFARSDEELNSHEWSTRVVMRTSAAAVRELRMNGNERALARELRWAGHVGAHAAIVDAAADAGEEGDVRVARVILSNIDALTHTKVWVRLLAGSGDAEIDEDAHARWRATDEACGRRSNVCALLHVTAAPIGRAWWERWVGERVGACALSVRAFVTNARGFPVLPKETQAMVRDMFRKNIQIMLTDWNGGPDGLASETIAPGDVAGDEGRVDVDSAHPMRLYWEYLVYLFRGVEPASEQALAEAPYRDYLQAPLQPLMDNLESVTYETFEKDASKYIQYEEAVRCALLDLVREGDEGSVMVVGAGRGPLVRASLRASERANRNIKVYAVEKNPNAVVTLQHLVAKEGWGDRVQIFPGDMRTCAADVRVDVLVSELLGSFGDNELSPECLDGAQRFLKPTGVSVPQSYESFVAPIAAAKLHDAVVSYKDLKSIETPYVVKFHRVHHIAEPKSVWEFEHPNNAARIDNERYARVEWSSEELGSASSTLHGFAAYFDATLYDGPAGCVRCSIHPHNHTLGPTGELMFSWFPMFFPIQTPVHIDRRGDLPTKIEFYIWRRVDAHKMWYEWAIAKPVQGHIHNPNGRSYWIGL